MSKQGAARKLLQAVSARLDKEFTDILGVLDEMNKRNDLTEFGKGRRSEAARSLDIIRLAFYDTIKLADELDIQAWDATLNSVNCETHRHYGYFCGTKDDAG